MKHIAFQSLIIFIVIGLVSCSPIYYGPNTQNVPLLNHSGEYNITASGNGELLELQGSVSPATHFGVQLNGAWYLPQKKDSTYRGAGYMVDAGLGYYTSFGPDDILIFETYFIGGIGGVRNTFTSQAGSNNFGTIYSNASRYGIQPAFGVKWKYLDAAISSRFVGLSYFNTSGNLVFDNRNQVDYLNENRHSFLIEPAITLRAGSDFLKAQLQLAGSFNMSNSNFHQRGNMLTIGLVLSPNRYRNIFTKKRTNQQ